MTKSDTADFLKNELLKINPCKHNIHKKLMITVIRKIKSFITDFVPTKSMLAKTYHNSLKLNTLAILSG